MILKRIIVDCILLICVFMLPWWVTMLLSLPALFYFDSFYEIVVLGLLIDSLYNAPIPRFYHIQFIVTIGAFIVYLIVAYIKGRIRFSR